MSEPTIKELAARLDALENPKRPEDPRTIDDLRRDLEAVVEGQRESVRIAVEGADYVDAVAAGVADQAREVTSYFVEAHEHIQGLSGDAKKRAEAAARDAMRNDKIMSDQARDAAKNAKAWRAAVVPSATARLKAYEDLLERAKAKDADHVALRAEMDAV